MQVSKHIHSCLYIKEKGKAVLIDPGCYSLEDKGISADIVDKLDYLLITHEHADHLDIPFVKVLTKKFPELTIISNESVQKILSAENVRAQINGDENINVVDAPHEHVFGAPQFQNVLFNVFSQLTHPGDNLHFKETCKILALPMQAPWGSLTQAVEKAIELKPEVVIPIHDWHWNEEAREAFYARLKDYFSQNDIKFLGLHTNEVAEV